MRIESPGQTDRSVFLWRHMSYESLMQVLPNTDKLL
jgi:hypothetical protein